MEAPARHKVKTVSQNRGETFENSEEQFPAESIFVKHHAAWPVLAFLVEAEAQVTQPQLSRHAVQEMANRESGLQMGECFNWLSVDLGLGTECQTHPCWHHHYGFTLHEEY